MQGLLARGWPGALLSAGYCQHDVTVAHASTFKLDPGCALQQRRHAGGGGQLGRDSDDTQEAVGSSAETVGVPGTAIGFDHGVYYHHDGRVTALPLAGLGRPGWGGLRV